MSYKEVYIGLVTMSLGNDFDNFNSKKWSRRHSFVERSESDDIFHIGSNMKILPPLDGKTIRGYHFEDIFKYLGIDESIYFPDTSGISLNILNYNDPSSYVTSFQVEGVVKTVADIRNNLAHGDGDIGEIFNIERKDRSVMSIIYYIDIYMNQIEYLGNVFFNYIENKLYLK